MFRAFMRTTLLLCLASFSLLPAAFAQDSVPLGDVARQNRARFPKKTEKVFTNDDIAPVGYNNGAVQGEAGNASPKPAPTPSSAEDKAKAKSSETEKAKGDKDESAKSGEPEKKDDKAAAAKPASADDRFRAEYTAKKNELTLLQRELSVSQQEYQLQTAHYYGDAGAALRDPKDWADKRKEYEEKIADKQKQVDEATQALTDIEEQGRKAGVSPRIFEPSEEATPATP
jgi:hypothetical protein